MHDQKESVKITGKFIAHDKHGVPVIIEWQKMEFFGSAFTSAMKDAWKVARESYLPVEMDFLRAYPEVVASEKYFAPFEPLFKEGLDAVDWDEAEKVMQELLKSHFIFDVSTFDPSIIAMFAQDECYFVVVKDLQTKALRGFITFMVRSSYPQGDTKGMSFAVDQRFQNCGLGKLLMSSIFKIKPDVKRIFLCTRVTNEIALNAYQSWGFTKDVNPILDHPFNLEHWTFLDYKADQKSILQNTAVGLAKVS